MFFSVVGGHSQISGITSQGVHHQYFLVLLVGAPESLAALSYPVPRKREQSLHTCAQDVQITRMTTI
jgi:hypothetical protein